MKAPSLFQAPGSPLIGSRADQVVHERASAQFPSGMSVRGLRSIGSLAELLLQGPGGLRTYPIQPRDAHYISENENTNSAIEERK